MGEEAAEAKASTAAPSKRGTKKRAVLAPLGLGAAGLLMGAQGADAATELSQLAASDSRLGIILTLFVPVIGWALFNVAGPAFAQLDVSQSGGWGLRVLGKGGGTSCTTGQAAGTCVLLRRSLFPLAHTPMLWGVQPTLIALQLIGTAVCLYLCISVLTRTPTLCLPPAEDGRGGC